MANQVWVVRHGTTLANQTRTLQGHSAAELAPEGRAQARQLGEYLAGREISFAALVASDLPRAWETASLLGQTLSLEVVPEPRLRECDFGEWVGLTYEEHEVRLAAAGGEPYQVVAPGGESPAQMARRVRAAFDDWIERPQLEGPLLLVTHGGPIQALVTRALGLPFCLEAGLSFRRSNTGYTILRRLRQDPQRFSVLTLNATPHLK